MDFIFVSSSDLSFSSCKLSNQYRPSNQYLCPIKTPNQIMICFIQSIFLWRHRIKGVPWTHQGCPGVHSVVPRNGHWRRTGMKSNLSVFWRTFTDSVVFILYSNFTSNSFFTWSLLVSNIYVSKKSTHVWWYDLSSWEAQQTYISQNLKKPTWEYQAVHLQYSLTLDQSQDAAAVCISYPDQRWAVSVPRPSVPRLSWSRYWFRYLWDLKCLVSKKSWSRETSFKSLILGLDPTRPKIKTWSRSWSHQTQNKSLVSVSTSKSWSRPSQKQKYHPPFVFFLDWL